MSREPEGEHVTAAPAAPPPAGADPGRLSALLVELARSDPDAARGWERVAFPGAVIAGRFELIRELGRGGFGVVFEARDRELGRLVAFKAVRPGNRASAAQRGELLRHEAQATAQLSHEHIIALYDAGRGAHGPYLVFELLDGETLAERLRRGRMDAGEALRVAVPVARALAHAHSVGVLHRDLKPSNVFLTARGPVKVLDFGLAHVFGWSGRVAGGTPAYMAPEQWRGEPEDARADVFALGVMLYEMLTGRLPYAVAEDGRSEAARPTAAAPALDGLPAPLRGPVASAISLEREARPRSVEVLLERLVEAAGASSGRASGWTRRRTAISAAVALGVAVAALGTWRAARRAPSAPDEHAAGARAAAPASLDAYAHYFHAREVADAGDIDAAEAELERALELDPELAMAHYYRAHLGEFAGVPMPTRRAQVEAALRFSDALPAKERLLVRAWGAHVRGDDAEAARVYRSAVTDFPDDPEVLYHAGDFRYHAGDLTGAAGLFQRAMDARPGWQPPLVHLVETFDGLGRLGEVLGPLRRAAASAPGPATYSALGAAHLALGAPEEAVRALRAAVDAGGGPETLAVLGDMLLRASRVAEAEAEARRLVAPEVPPRLQLTGYELLFKVRAFQGRRHDALRVLDEMPPVARAVSPVPAQRLLVTGLALAGGEPERLWLEARRLGSPLAAVSLAYAGELARASELARGLEPGPHRELVHGLVAWRQGRREVAVTRLGAAARQGAKTRPVASMLLAEVLAELGRDEEALAARSGGVEGQHELPAARPAAPAQPARRRPVPGAARSPPGGARATRRAAGAVGEGGPRPPRAGRGARAARSARRRWDARSPAWSHRRPLAEADPRGVRRRGAPAPRDRAARRLGRTRQARPGARRLTERPDTGRRT